MIPQNVFAPHGGTAAALTWGMHSRPPLLAVTLLALHGCETFPEQPDPQPVSDLYDGEELVAVEQSLTAAETAFTTSTRFQSLSSALRASGFTLGATASHYSSSRASYAVGSVFTNAGQTTSVSGTVRPIYLPGQPVRYAVDVAFVVTTGGPTSGPKGIALGTTLVLLGRNLTVKTTLHARSTSDRRLVAVTDYIKLGKPSGSATLAQLNTPTATVGDLRANLTNDSSNVISTLAGQATPITIIPGTGPQPVQCSACAEAQIQYGLKLLEVVVTAAPVALCAATSPAGPPVVATCVAVALQAPSVTTGSLGGDLALGASELGSKWLDAARCHVGNAGCDGFGPFICGADACAGGRCGAGFKDDCGNIVICGCPSGTACDVPLANKCTSACASSCAAAGRTCGTLSKGATACECGTCPSNSVCNGAGTCSSCGAWSACVYASPCATAGSRTRSCGATVQTDTTVCRRSVEGMTCAPKSCGSPSACNYSSVCDESATQTRSCQTSTCDAAGKCVARATTETLNCGRNTDGVSCGTNGCDAWSCGYSSTCDESATGTRRCTYNTCVSGACVRDSFTETMSCTRNTDGASCSDNDSCTTPDKCSSGSCIPGPRSCGPR